MVFAGELELRCCAWPKFRDPGTGDSDRAESEKLWDNREGSILSVFWERQRVCLGGGALRTPWWMRDALQNLVWMGVEREVGEEKERDQAARACGRLMEERAESVCAEARSHSGRAGGRRPLRGGRGDRASRSGRSAPTCESYPVRPAGPAPDTSRYLCAARAVARISGISRSLPPDPRSCFAPRRRCQPHGRFPAGRPTACRLVSQPPAQPCGKPPSTLAVQCDLVAAARCVAWTP